MENINISQTVHNETTEQDPLFEEVARLVVQKEMISTSCVQRIYYIGFNRASRIMDQLEAAGIIGPTQGDKPRKVLVDLPTLEAMLKN